jgi:ACS family glucarate transporter-like MFS transporter
MVALLSVITYIDRGCISVAGPRMQDQLHISPHIWGWVNGLFLVSYGLFEIPSGAMGDRLGPRRVLTRIVLWWSVFTSLTGAVSNLYTLLLVRFCFGMGEAGASPNASIVIARWVPVGKRARACGVWTMMAQLGGAISPLLVVPIQMRFGWRSAFYCFGLLGLIWAVAWYSWFRDSPAEKPGVTQSERIEIGETFTSSHKGLRWADAVRNSNLWLLMSVTACYCYSLYFFQSWLATYLVKGRGYSESELPFSALPFLVGGVMNLMGGVASDWLVRIFGLSVGRRVVGVAGSGGAALCLVAAMLTTGRAWLLIMLALVYGGVAVQQTNVYAVCQDIGRRSEGTVLGFINTAAAAGGLVSTVSFGYIVERFGNYDAPLIPMMVALCIGTFLWMRIDATREVHSVTTTRQLISTSA